MNNSYWYWLLVVLSVIVFLYTFRRTNLTLLLPFIFALAGMAYIIEFTIFSILKSYRYIPHILKDPNNDSQIGAVVSDNFSIPAIAILIVGMDLGWRWMIGLAGMFVGIEWFFEKLGIYEQNWWKHCYTFGGLVVFFRFAKTWFRSLRKPITGKLRLWTLWSIGHAFNFTLGIILYGVMRSRYFTVAGVEKLNLDSSAINTPFSLLISLILAVTVYYQARWHWQAACIAGLFGIDLIMMSVGILHPRTPWDHVYSILFNLFVLLFLLISDKILREAR